MHPGGKFAGVGSRESRRPDERITEDIHARLMQHGLIDASELDVIVVQGQAVLTGVTCDEQMKELAGRVARSVWGVTRVDNRIRPLYRRHRAA
jgi:osmotically-inducible protein OsmY